MKSVPDLSLTIPLLNEEDGVQDVVNSITKHLSSKYIKYQIILVNNGSTDNTQKVIEYLARRDPGILPLRLEVNKGYGGGILAGLERASAPIVGYLWGDEQVAPYVLTEAWRAIHDQNVDIAKARRRVRLDGFDRFLITRAYHCAVSALFPCPSRDINGCPKLFKREVLDRIRPQSTDWFIDAEIMLKAQKLGFRIHEIDVVAWPRLTGRSKVRWETLGEFALNLIRLRVGSW